MSPKAYKTFKNNKAADAARLRDEIEAKRDAIKLNKQEVRESKAKRNVYKLEHLIKSDLVFFNDYRTTRAQIRLIKANAAVARAEQKTARLSGEAKRSTDKANCVKVKRVAPKLFGFDLIPIKNNAPKGAK